MNIFIFLQQIKLVNINTTDVVDGRPSIVLGLIWTIILYFQARVHGKKKFLIFNSFTESVSEFPSSDHARFSIPRLRNSPAHYRLRMCRLAARPRWTAPTAQMRPAHLSNASHASPSRAEPRRLCLNGFRKPLPSTNLNTHSDAQFQFTAVYAWCTEIVTWSHDQGLRLKAAEKDRESS